MTEPMMILSPWSEKEHAHYMDFVAQLVDRDGCYALASRYDDVGLIGAERPEDGAILALFNTKAAARRVLWRFPDLERVTMLPLDELLYGLLPELAQRCAWVGTTINRHADWIAVPAQQFLDELTLGFLRSLPLPSPVVQFGPAEAVGAPRTVLLSGLIGRSFGR